MVIYDAIDDLESMVEKLLKTKKRNFKKVLRKIEKDLSTFRKKVTLNKKYINYYRDSLGAFSFSMKLNCSIVRIQKLLRKKTIKRSQFNFIILDIDSLLHFYNEYRYEDMFRMMKDIESKCNSISEVKNESETKVEETKVEDNTPVAKEESESDDDEITDEVEVPVTTDEVEVPVTTDESEKTDLENTEPNLPAETVTEEK